MVYDVDVGFDVLLKLSVSFAFIKKKKNQNITIQAIKNILKRGNKFVLNNHSLKLNKEASIEDKGKHCENY